MSHVEWLAKRAIACGATTLKKIEGCTHFIALNNQSETARKAYAMGVRIVKPAWYGGKEAFFVIN